MLLFVLHILCGCDCKVDECFILTIVQLSMSDQLYYGTEREGHGSLNPYSLHAYGEILQIFHKCLRYSHKERKSAIIVF